MIVRQTFFLLLTFIFTQTIFANTETLDTVVNSYLKSKTENFGNSLGRSALGQSFLSTDGYGCFCRQINDNSFKMNEAPARTVIGHSLDPFDEICKTLVNGWSCLSAEGCDLNSQNYTTPNFFQLSSANPDDFINECERLNTLEEYGSNHVNAQNLCKIEVKFATDFITEFFTGPSDSSYQENGVLEQDELDQLCQPPQPQMSAVPLSWMRCCDAKKQHPFKMAYSSSTTC